MKRSQSSSADDELSSPLWDPSYPRLTREELEALVQRAVRMIRQEQERIARNPRAHLQESIYISGYSQRLWLAYREQGRIVLSLLVRHERVGLPWLFTDWWYKEAILQELKSSLPQEGQGRTSQQSRGERWLNRRKSNDKSRTRYSQKKVALSLVDKIPAEIERLQKSGWTIKEAKKQALNNILSEWEGKSRAKDKGAICAIVKKILSSNCQHEK